MVDFNTAIELIRRNGGFKPNKRDDSYYRTYKTQGNRPQQARISNHGTHLWTWYDRDYDPSYAINTCIVFSESGTHDSDVSVDMNIKDKQVNVIGQRKTMEVIQYVYNCQLLDENDTSLINKEVQSIWQNNGFKDPLAGTPKHAKVFKLIPNQPIQTITENKQYNKNKNMKQTIKLRESELKRVIAESVKRVINEVWDIDDNGVIDYDEFGRAKNRSYADMRGISRSLPSDTKEFLRTTPHRDSRAETNYQYRLNEPNGREFSDDSGEWLRPSDWFVRGAAGRTGDEFKDYDKQISKNHGTNISAADRRWMKAADSRPLHRKGSLNREMDEAINRIVSATIRRNIR